MYYFQLKPMSGEAYVVECTMDINEAHHKMAYMGEDIVCKTMACYSIKLTGKMEPCGACLRANSRAKNMIVWTKQLENTYIWTLVWGHLNRTITWQIML